MMKIIEGARSVEEGKPPVKLNCSSSAYGVSEDVDMVRIIWLSLLPVED